MVRLARLALIIVLAAGFFPAAAQSPDPPPSPPAFLLLHGWAGDSSSWRPVASLLGSEDSAIDLPGHGTSTREVTGWTVGDFARAVEDERVRRNIGCLVVGAHSNGAYIAREYARLYPDHLGALVIVEGTFLLTFDTVDQFAAYRAGIDRNWTRIVQNPPGLVRAGPATAATVRRMLAGASKATALATFDMLASGELRSEQVVDVPVTFALADAPMWTEPHFDRLRMIAPNSSVIHLGAVSHFPQLDRPEAIAEVFRRAAAAARCPNR